MKSKIIFKTIAAAVILAVGAVSLTAIASERDVIKIYGADDDVLGQFDASQVSYLQFEEEIDYPNAEVDKNGNIIIMLSPEVKFKMIKVDAYTDLGWTRSEWTYYRLRGGDMLSPTWTSETKERRINPFYLGEFVVTQDICKSVTGKNMIVQSGWEDQVPVGDNYPAFVDSWNDIETGDNCFLAKINTMLTAIKQNNPSVAELLGDKEFRLPSEWEWEYAASGGMSWESVLYYFSGTSQSSLAAAQTVAVVDAESIAPVGTKLPNVLGLYDMSGNINEWCSGLGYPGHEDTPGYLHDNGDWSDSERPARGGNYAFGMWQLNQCVVSYRLYESVDMGMEVGFRLAL